jgi:hypothetical protein
VISRVAKLTAEKLGLQSKAKILLSFDFLGCEMKA